MWFELNQLTEKISQVQRFYRDSSLDTKHYDEQREVRSAENELIRITRKLASIKPVLKHLSNVRLVETKEKYKAPSSFKSASKNKGEIKPTAEIEVDLG